MEDEYVCNMTECSSDVKTLSNFNLSVQFTHFYLFFIYDIYNFLNRVVKMPYKTLAFSLKFPTPTLPYYGIKRCGKPILDFSFVPNSY